MSHAPGSGAQKWALAFAAILIISAVVAYKQRRKTANEEKAAFQQKWQFKASGPVTGLALGDDGTVYATSADGFLWALDSSGKLQWKFEAGPMQAGPTLGEDGNAYLLNSKQEIFRVDRSGSLIWSGLGGPYADKVGGLAQAIDSDYLYTFWRGQPRAVRLSRGKIDWEAGVGYTGLGSISVLPGGKIVYTGLGRVEEAGFEGRIVWQYPVIDPPVTVDMLLKNNGRGPIGNFWVQSGIAVGADGTLYAGVARSKMVALSSDGTLRWEFKVTPGVDDRATPVISQDGTIYFASGDWKLHSLNPDGTEKWALDMGSPVATTPLLAEDGTIYVLNSTGLMAASPEGKLLARLQIGGAAISSPTLGLDGTVYVGMETGKVIAFAGIHGGLMKSPWPKFQADLANSGRAPQY